MKDTITWVGLDAHSATIQVAMLLPGRTEPVQWQVANEPRDVRRMVRKIRRRRELEPARDHVRRPIWIVKPDEVIVASHDDVGTAVAVDVADVDTFGDLPVDALVDVMPDELQHR